MAGGPRLTEEAGAKEKATAKTKRAKTNATGVAPGAAPSGRRRRQPWPSSGRARPRGSGARGRASANAGWCSDWRWWPRRWTTGRRWQLGEALGYVAPRRGNLADRPGGGYDGVSQGRRSHSRCRSRNASKQPHQRTGNRSRHGNARNGGRVVPARASGTTRRCD